MEDSLSQALQPAPTGRQQLERALSRQFAGQELNIEREYCERRLANFVKRAWHVLEPQTRLAHGFYIDAICEHLEAMYRGDIRNLVINIPPRFLKSMLCAVFFPAWVWTQAPHLRFLYSSYAEWLSRRDSRKTRVLIRSNWYQQLWGEVYRLEDDQNQIMRFDNNEHGYRIATSVGSIGQTGEGGDFIAVDDPISIMDSFSKRELDNVITWWDEQMSTRFNDPHAFSRLIVMQRSHVNDLSGHALAQGGYEHLCLPLEYEPSRCCYTSVRPARRAVTQEEDREGRYRWDDRREENESLNPERFGPNEIRDLRQRLVTAHAADAQLQQRPSPRGGGMIKLDWFRRYGTPPAEFDYIVHSWDTANKGGQANAYSVGGVWGVTETCYYLLHVYRDRLNIPDLERLVKHAGHFDSFGPPAAILVEDAASGTGVIQHLQSETNLPVIAWPVKEDKVTRMDTETPMIESGRVALPREADWLYEFEREIGAFPNSDHKDQADQMSQFLRWVRLGRSAMEEDDWYLY